MGDTIHQLNLLLRKCNYAEKTAKLRFKKSSMPYVSKAAKN
jgi:hypothetical protein